MTTSGVTTFNLDSIEIIEEAFERAGLESRSGYDMRTARRSLNLMSLEWANRGLNLWTIEERQLAIGPAAASYTLDTDVIDLFDFIVRKGVLSQQFDYPLERISLNTYASRSNKNVPGRPTELYIDRQRAAPVVTFWPVPEDDTYTFVYWVLRRMQDVGVYTNEIDIPALFLPALAAGLAYHLAMKSKDPEVRANMRDLKMVYEEQFQMAAEENRIKAPLRIVPRLPRVL